MRTPMMSKSTTTKTVASVTTAMMTLILTKTIALKVNKGWWRTITRQMRSSERNEDDDDGDIGDAFGS